MNEFIIISDSDTLEELSTCYNLSNLLLLLSTQVFQKESRLAIVSSSKVKIQETFFKASHLMNVNSHNFRLITTFFDTQSTLCG